VLRAKSGGFFHNSVPARATMASSDHRGLAASIATLIRMLTDGEKLFSLEGNSALNLPPVRWCACVLSNFSVSLRILKFSLPSFAGRKRRRANALTSREWPPGPSDRQIPFQHPTRSSIEPGSRYTIGRRKMPARRISRMSAHIASLFPMNVDFKRRVLDTSIETRAAIIQKIKASKPMTTSRPIRKMTPTVPPMNFNIRGLLRRIY